jgi:hypothetical protein
LITLLADASVNALAQQIRMTVVAGVLLDHVDQKLPQRDRFAGAISANKAEICVTGELLGEADLVSPRGPRLIDHCLISHGTVEVAIGLSLRLVAIGYVKTREPLPEPLALDLGQVSHEAEQREGRRINRTTGELFGVQALTLELHGKALATQELDQCFALVAERRTSLTRVGLWINKHVGAVLRLRHATMFATSPRNGNSVHRYRQDWPLLFSG